MDNFINIGARNNALRLALRCGYIIYIPLDTLESTFYGKKQPVFGTQHIDKNPIPNKLATAINTEKPPYFYKYDYIHMQQMTKSFLRKI